MLQSSLPDFVHVTLALELNRIEMNMFIPWKTSENDTKVYLMCTVPLK